MLSPHPDSTDKVAQDEENSEEILVASIAGVVSESKIGKNIGLSFDESKLHLFDMNSDQRIN